MRALVIFRTLNTIGGAEFLCLSALKALLEDKFEITLLTLERTSWQTIAKRLGNIFDPLNEINEISIERYRTGSIYETLVDSKILALKVPQLNRSIDLTINLNANDLPVNSDFCYIHYPTGPAIYWNVPSATSVRDPKYTNSLGWKMYYQPYRILFNRASNRIKNAKTLVTNGKLSADLISKFYDRSPVILSPPIFYEPGKAYVGIKQPKVVTISRFDQNKELYSLIRAAQHLPNIDFYIVGAVNLDNPPVYYLRVSRDITSLKLRNLHVVLNSSEEVKIDLLSKALIYVHPGSYEHFGISVLEAMRAGAVVIVRKSSGAWLDIVSEGLYGFGFTTQEELEALLHTLTQDEELVSRYSKISIERAHQFSYESFKSQLLRLIKNN